MTDDLVKRLRDHTCDCFSGNTKHLTWEAADRIEKLETELKDAIALAHELAVDIATTHYPEVSQFKPFKSLTGLLSQIDNMTSGLIRKEDDEIK